MTQNRELLELERGILERTERISHQQLRSLPDRAEEIQMLHKPIVTAIRRRDAKAVRAALERDVRQGQIDLFGSGIEVRRNRVAAHSLTLKLIHGARAIVATDNEFTPGPSGRAIGMFRANPPEPRRQVQDILIERNRIDLSSSQRSGVAVDAAGEYAPAGISLRQNLFVVGQCRHEAIACSLTQCTTADNSKVQAKGGAPCKD